MMFIVEENFD
jgi:hypothetical protein